MWGLWLWLGVCLYLRSRHCFGATWNQKTTLRRLLMLSLLCFVVLPSLRVLSSPKCQRGCKYSRLGRTPFAVSSCAVMSTYFVCVYVPKEGMGDVFELVLSALLEAQNLAALIHWGGLFPLRACVNAALWSVLACTVCGVFRVSSVDSNGILSAVRHPTGFRRGPCLVKNIVKFLFLLLFIPGATFRQVADHRRSVFIPLLFVDSLISTTGSRCACRPLSFLLFPKWLCRKCFGLPQACFSVADLCRSIAHVVSGGLCEPSKQKRSETCA